jgi:hypothetical protein
MSSPVNDQAVVLVPNEEQQLNNAPIDTVLQPLAHSDQVHTQPEADIIQAQTETETQEDNMSMIASSGSVTEETIEEVGDKQDDEEEGIIYIKTRSRPGRARRYGRVQGRFRSSNLVVIS